MRQLALGLRLPTDAGFDNFIAGDNREAIAVVRALAEGDGEHFITLWGQEGNGKSHLLQAACRLADQNRRSAFYLSLADPELPQPELLSGMENMDLVAIDDIDAISGHREWEEALYQLYNAIRGKRGYLLVSSGAALAQLSLELPDLKSRLSWGPVYHLAPLSDIDKAAALRSFAGEKGLKLPEEVLNYLMTHQERNLEKLLNLLDQLDQASLEAKRGLTLPFVRQWLTRDHDS